MSNLTFKSVGSSSVALSSLGTPNQISLQYSKNNSAWQSYTVGEAISLQNNDTVQFSGTAKFSKSVQSRYNFITTGEGTLVLSGDLISLVSSATIEDEYEFNSLFSGCANITDASNLTLPSNTTNWCYTNLFKNCSNLTTPPSALPAETLSPWCYQGMFANCTSLTAAPELSSTELSRQSYYAMFYNCPALTDSPSLPAEQLQAWCYNAMFYNCETLSAITCDLSAFTPSTATKNWVFGVASAGTFTNGTVTEEFGTSKIPSGWQLVNPTPPAPDYSTMPLTVENIGTGTIRFSVPNTKNDIMWRINNGSWESAAGQYVQMAVNDKIELSGASVTAIGGQFGNSFINGGKLHIYGNCNSLIGFSNNLPSAVFKNLFRGCAGIYSLENFVLPATTLAESCYYDMFYGCSDLSLVPADLLPATTMVLSCYYQMFGACTSLSVAPKLPATDLVRGCYYMMFDQCSNLSEVYSKASAYDGSYSMAWLRGTKSTGTFHTTTSYNDFQRGENKVPSNWTLVRDYN